MEQQICWRVHTKSHVWKYFVFESDDRWRHRVLQSKGRKTSNVAKHHKCRLPDPHLRPKDQLPAFAQVFKVRLQWCHLSNLCKSHFENALIDRPSKPEHEKRIAFDINRVFSLSIWKPIKASRYATRLVQASPRTSGFLLWLTNTDYCHPISSHRNIDYVGQRV